MRRAGKIDANQNSIVKDIRLCGFSVHITSGLGDGFPDILVGAFGHLILFEIKKSPSDKLTPKEVAFARRFSAYHVYRINSFEELLAVLANVRDKQ